MFYSLNFSCPFLLSDQMKNVLDKELSALFVFFYIFSRSVHSTVLQISLLFCCNLLPPGWRIYPHLLDSLCLRERTGCRSKEGGGVRTAGRLPSVPSIARLVGSTLHLFAERPNNLAHTSDCECFYYILAISFIILCISLIFSCFIFFSLDAPLAFAVLPSRIALWRVSMQC